jgi:hypothetical protein
MTSTGPSHGIAGHAGSWCRKEFQARAAAADYSIDAFATRRPFAGRRLTTPADIVGRPAPVWSLERDDSATIQCLSATTNNGQIRVWVVSGVTELHARVFDDAHQAMQWAVELEHKYVGTKSKIRR